MLKKNDAFEILFVTHNMMCTVHHHHHHRHHHTQWRIQIFFKKGGGRLFISSVLIYRKCAQQNICLLHGKSGFLKKL